MSSDRPHLRSVARPSSRPLFLGLATALALSAPGAQAPAGPAPGVAASPTRQALPRTADGFRRELRAALVGTVTARGPVVEFRTVDGSDNNPLNPSWGQAGIPLRRLTEVAYDDGLSAPARPGNESARAISNVVCAQSGPMPAAGGLSDYVWQWGQFLDHDIDLTPGMEPEEPMPIEVPLGDAWFDPQSLGGMTIPFSRSIHATQAGDVVRQQLNLITAYIDGSNVYGSDQETADALRAFSRGRLKTSNGGLLPMDPDAPGFFLAGDERANEQVGLTSMHTLFVREHNTLAAAIASLHPALDDEALYQLARTIVWAELQAITFNEFLPVLLGPGALEPYQGWDSNRNPGIANFFSTGAYRFGHSMLSPQLLRIDQQGNEIPNGHLALKDAFFDPTHIMLDGIDPVLRGLAAQVPQTVDVHVVDDVRNFLFGPPGSGGMDLAALNLQRGRDHGIAGYNRARLDYGLRAVTDFDEITSDADLLAYMEQMYASVDDVDPWIGGLAEDPHGDALVGELVFTVLKDQFEALRDGDRFFYRGFLRPELVAFVERQTLASILRRNTRIGAELADDVFHVPN